MKPATALFQNGELKLTSPVDWPDGTPVEVRPVMHPERGNSWLSLPPLDVGRFEESAGRDDLLGEMLDDSRS